MASSWLRIAVVQFAPKLGEVQANIAKARELCRGLTPRSVDVVCFPEMIFTGYMFPDASSIAPFLEHVKTGPTASFCKALAGRLECVVVAGFPERLVSVSGDPPPPPLPTSTESRSAGANAAGVYDPTGLRHVYHKSNLFPTDRTWACPGGGFTTVDLPLPSSPSHTNDVEGSSDANATATAALPVRTAVAICNDLNVTAGETWTSIEHGPYELAGYCVREGVRVVLLLNAWLRSEDGGMERVGDRERERGVDGNEDEGEEEEEEEEDVGEEDDGEPNWEVLNYWAMRLRPLWAAPEPNAVDNKTRTGAEEATQSADANAQQDVIVVVCNRTGRERGKTFAGSSAIFAMRPGSGKPRLLHFMGEREEGVRVWNVRVGSQTGSS